MAIVALDPKFSELIDLDAKVEKIASGFKFTEGPVWNHRERALLFVDINFADPTAGVIHRWTEKEGTTVFRSPSQNSNGNTYDLQGRLITCVGATHKVVRTNADGSIETLAESFNGRALNSPNDVICAPNGDILFTDPYFVRGEMPDPPPVLAVYRISARDGSLTLLTTDVAYPNGLVISDDGSRLYVDDTRAAHVKVFDVATDGSVSNGRVFCTISAEGLPKDFADFLAAQHETRAPDGMKMDSRGNLYVAGNRNEGIWVFDPSGKLLGCIGFEKEPAVFGEGMGGPSNLAWGDDDWSTIYATAVTSVYRVRMKVAGQPVHST
ncbi:MAG TPA: SMP-30/gluconolactonase/LRE family protein [Dehalococcoidia bacterium]|nr:SMP-30/gluconolactonase/LRE family protein [Dehalococcoidia bacterium]